MHVHSPTHAHTPSLPRCSTTEPMIGNGADTKQAAPDPSSLSLYTNGADAHRKDSDTLSENGASHRPLVMVFPDTHAGRGLKWREASAGHGLAKRATEERSAFDHPTTTQEPETPSNDPTVVQLSCRQPATRGNKSMSTCLREPANA